MGFQAKKNIDRANEIIEELTEIREHKSDLEKECFFWMIIASPHSSVGKII